MKHHTLIFTGLICLLELFLATPLKSLAQSTTAIVVKAGESRFGVPTPFFGVNPNDLKLSSKDTKGKLSAFYYKGNQKIGPALHLHYFQDEMFYILSGKYIFQLGKEKQMLKAGDLVFLPRNIPHAWVQVSDTGEMFYFLQPAGQMEEFFLKMTEMGGKASEQEFARVREACGIKDVGPALNATDQHVFTEKFTNGFVVKSGTGRFGDKTVLNGVSPNDMKVSGKDTVGELSVFEYTGNEKGGPPLHVHPNQDEVFFITQGEYLFKCGDEKFTLVNGDMIFLPRGIAHTWAQLTEQGKMLFFFQPSGRMEDFFRSLGNQKGPISPEAGEKLFAGHEMKIVGPPLTY